MTRKRCTKCKEEKEISEFRQRTETTLTSWCISCLRHASKIRQREYRKTHPNDPAYMRKYRESHREQLRRKDIARTYGLIDYEHMLEEQEGKCAICGRETALVIDHNHQTGEVRGLLCSNCNVGLGYFMDSPKLLEQASSYARKWKHGKKK